MFLYRPYLRFNFLFCFCGLLEKSVLHHLKYIFEAFALTERAAKAQYHTMSEHQMKVIIVGGSVAGLTLAHCLERLNIDYIILEGYREIAPQVGASIGILANGARILDQLGCWDDIAAQVEPLGRSVTWDAKGKLLSSNDYPELLHKRFVIS